MDKFLKAAQKEGAEYAEIISLSSLRSSIEVSDKDVKEMSAGDAVIYHSIPGGRLKIPDPTVIGSDSNTRN